MILRKIKGSFGFLTSFSVFRALSIYVQYFIFYHSESSNCLQKRQSEVDLVYQSTAADILPASLKSWTASSADLSVHYAKSSVWLLFPVMYTNVDTTLEKQLLILMVHVMVHSHLIDAFVDALTVTIHVKMHARYGAESIL